MKKSKLHKDVFKSLFDNSHDGIIISDFQSIIIDINPSFEKISGHKRDKVIGKILTDYIPESFHEKLSIRLKELDTHLSVELGEYKIFDKSGSIKIVEASSVIIPYKSGKAILSNIRDITERKKIELELISAKEKAEENQNRYKLLSDLSLEGVAIHKDGLFLDVNMAFCNIFGRVSNELIGIHAGSLLFPSDQINSIRNRHKHGVTEPYQVKGKKKDGTEIWLEIEGRNYTYRNEQVRVAIFRDITIKREYEIELIKAKETALKEKQFSENLIRSLPGMFFLAEIKDNGAYLLKWNDNYEKETQYSSDELYYKNTLDFFCEDEIEQLYNFFQKLAEGKTVSAILNPIIKDGSIRRYIFQAVGFEENGKNYYLGSGIDITEKRDLELKLIESVIQTEEAERRRIASDLHDGLGPELSTVKLYIQGLIDATNDVEKNEISNKLMDLINHSIDNLSEISFNISPHILLDYGLEEAIKIYIDKLQIKPELEITTHFDKIERFDINKELTLYRTISELFNNTIKYADATEIKLEISIIKKEIYIYYADNGKGFSVEKELEKKTGMGIQNMISRIKSLEGTIKIQSKIDEGMSVAIYLPYILKDE